MRHSRRSRLLHVRNWLIKLSIDRSIHERNVSGVSERRTQTKLYVFENRQPHADWLAREAIENGEGRGERKVYLIKWKWQIIDYTFCCSGVGTRIRTCYLKAYRMWTLQTVNSHRSAPADILTHGLVHSAFNIQPDNGKQWTLNNVLCDAQWLNQLQCVTLCVRRVYESMTLSLN